MIAATAEVGIVVLGFLLGRCLDQLLGWTRF